MSSENSTRGIHANTNRDFFATHLRMNERARSTLSCAPFCQTTAPDQACRMPSAVSLRTNEKHHKQRNKKRVAHLRTEEGIEALLVNSFHTGYLITELCCFSVIEDGFLLIRLNADTGADCATSVFAYANDARG